MDPVEQNITPDTSIHNQGGASLVEYTLLIALMALVALAVMQTFGSKMSQQFSSEARIL
jgi:Flp pilus assembly pilin Flp